MRHRYSRLRLKQKPAHAAQLSRNLVTSLVLYEAIRTTKKRAQVISPIFDHLVTIAKTKEPHNAIRQINQVVTHKNACRKVMEVLTKRFVNRSSGYTRMVPVGSRIGDGAMVVDLMLMEGEEVTIPEKIEKTKKKSSKPSSSSESSVAV